MIATGNGMGGTPSSPPIDSSSIKRECIRHTHQNLIAIFVSVTIASAFLLYVLADKIGSTHILAWFTAIMFCTALRLWFYLAFRRHAREAFDPVFWGRAQSFLTIISGIIWGAAPLAAYPRDSLSQQMFIALIAAGGAAGGTYAYAAMPRTAQAFLTAALFPIVAVNLAMGGAEHFPVGVMLAIYYLTLVIITKNNSRTVRSAITLALEKTALAEQMGKAEQAIRESEKKYRSLFNNAIDAVIIFDAETRRFLDANGAFLKIYGYDRADLPNLAADDISAEPDKTRDSINQTLTTGMDVLVPIRWHRKKDGTRFPVELTGGFFEWNGRRVMFGVIRDITTRVTAEERLITAKEEAEEATLLKDKFVSLVSHDLKNPLSTVQGFLTMLHFEHDNIGKDEAKAMIVNALEASNGMLHLIDDLLEISRIKTGQLRPRISLTDLHFIADNAVMAYSAFAAEKLIEIKNEVPPKTTVYADEHLLLQVLKNLLSNALKFCREGGGVRIYLPEPGTVAVADTGVGIPPSLLSHIFKYEVKTSTPGTRGEGGTGLGLPLSHDIMKAHGGGLRVESEAGKGSTFYIILPPSPVF